ncbi:hypothetical protein A8B73_14190 [Methylosinus sp. 3S-1]|nr:hypothetical protein A8B73_14190 [Methylosinus sp. 3S-1]
MPDPQAPQRNRPDRSERWYRRGPRGSGPRARLARLRSAALSHVSRSTIASCGASARCHSLDGFGREMRRPVEGSLTIRTRFQTSSPT